MKKNVKKVVILTIFFMLSLALHAQELGCSKFYPLKKGVTFELTNYNRKGKINSVTKNKISNTTDQNATISTEVYSRKGKKLMESEYDISCSDNGISINFKSLLSGDMMKQHEGMTINATGENINLPNNLKVGQKLPDANLEATIDAEIVTMKMNFNITNREVVGNESITTSAGTFNCIVITYNFNSKTMGINSSGSSKQWFAEGVGLVKSEDYNSKGKLISHSELTKLSK